MLTALFLLFRPGHAAPDPFLKRVYLLLRQRADGGHFQPNVRTAHRLHQQAFVGLAFHNGLAGLSAFEKPSRESSRRPPSAPPV